MTKEYLIVIPARYKSTRFPGKPLINIAGKSMLQRVYNKCLSITTIDQIIVATDDSRIEDHCKLNKINVIRTSVDCLTGTDRVAEVAKLIPAKFYINVQCDEPLIDPLDIERIINAYRKKINVIYCAMTKINSDTEYFNKNIPKIVTRNDHTLMYISRSGIPTPKNDSFIPTMKQVCIYAFSNKHLKEFGVGKNKTKNEKIEDIEILRFLDLGYKVSMIEVSKSSIAVDTPEDLKKVLLSLND